MWVDDKTVEEGNAHVVAEWCGGLVVTEHDPFDHRKTQPGVNVPCGSKVKRASVGDTVVQFANGEFDVLRVSP